MSAYAELLSIGGLFARLFYDSAFSWSRMIVALIVSILFSWIVGIVAARSERGEKVILPVLDIMQSIPILGFFPVVLVLFVAVIPPPLGVDLAVIFLIFTCMAWNITFGVYEAVKSIPKDYLDLATIQKMGFFSRLSVIYIPSTWSKVAYNAIISWAIAFFYLIASEIFTLGNSNTRVSNGIGVDIAYFASRSEWGPYAAAVVCLIVVDLLTWGLVLDQLARWSEKYKLDFDPQTIRKNGIYRFYSRLNGILITHLSFALTTIRNSKWISDRAPEGLARGARALRNSARSIRKELIVGTAAPVLAIGLFLPVRSLVVALNPATFSLVASDEVEVAIALAVSFARVWASYLIAVAISLPLGIIVALNGKLYSVVSPILQIGASVPAPVILPPIALLIVTMPGGGEINAIIVIVLGMAWYLIFNVMEGIRSIPSQTLDTAKLLKLEGRRLWTNILIPAALPSFVTGSITAVGGAWNALIVAEYFSVNPASNGHPITQVSLGIGKLLDIASLQGNFLLLGLAVGSMTALIVVFDTLVWKKLYRHVTTTYAQVPAR